MTILAAIEICTDHQLTGRLERLAGIIESQKQYPTQGREHSQEFNAWEDDVMTWYFKHLADIARVPDADEILAHNPGMEDE